MAAEESNADPKLAALIASVRRRCKPGLWSQGVTLARAGAVTVESRTPEEIVVRVRSPGRVVAPTAVLYSTENETECDCPSRVSPCEHVAAAAIALSAAGTAAAAGAGATAAGGGEAAAAPVPQRPAPARIGYRFERAEGGLRLQRVLVAADGAETVLETELTALLADPAKAAQLQVEEADLQADRLLGAGAAARRVALVATKLTALTGILEGAPRITLDGVAIGISEEELRPVATLTDRSPHPVGEGTGGHRAGAISLVITADARIRQVVSPGVALCDDDDGRAMLHRLLETELTGVWLQNLPIRRTFSAAEMGELVTVVLPDLARRAVVDIRSDRVPAVARDLAPRIVLDLDQVEGGLSVLPTLVYGAPPVARVDAGKLVYLRGAVPLRDAAAEQRAVERLRGELDLVVGRRMTFDARDAPRFVEKLKRWRGDLAGRAAGVVKPAATLVPRLRVIESAASGGPHPGPLPQAGEGIGSAGAGAPDLRFELSFEVQGAQGKATAVDAAEVVRAWQEGLGLVPLAEGGWAGLPASWLAKHGQRVADLLAAREDDGRLARHALPALAALCAELEQPPPPGLDRLAPLVHGFERLPEVAPPSDLTATLRAYQRQGVNWLAFLRGAGLGGILADDMGLGKTLQAMCAFPPATLVVCPTSVVFNWKSELQRFRPDLRVAVYHGPNRSFDDAADVTLTTYAILRLDAKALAARSFGAVVLDEAQAIKNPDSQTARAAYALRAGFRLALTGTPVENRLEELWSLMHFANRGLLGGRSDFSEQVARPIAEGRAGAAAALRQRIRPFILRRLKQDVAPELPPRTESVLRVELTDGERAVYDAVRAATQKDVLALLQGGDGDGGKGGGSIIKALEALLRLRQAACHPALVPGQTAATSSKIEALLEALDTAVAEGHKALVFSQWTSLLDLIEPALARAELPFARLDGTTRDRAGVVARFQAPDGAGPPVMLVSLKAGGSGLNLTAADHVFLCDPWWNPAVEAQAADRTHRIGQTRPVFVYRLVAAATVEERILTLQDAKRALMDAALGDAASAAGLTREDLLALLA
ncbi:MAG TPA: DEAD/DEAH box helicase [Polyangia bacterium]|jgi:superfamily II DNA or RNA helicase